MSSLALGYNGIEIQRGMTTSSTAIFVPFMTRELRMDGPSLYYCLLYTSLHGGTGNGGFAIPAPNGKRKTQKTGGICGTSPLSKTF